MVHRSPALLFVAVVLAASAGVVPSALAQADGAVTGRVVAEDTDAPLEGATVALWAVSAEDSTLVSGTATGPDGAFALEDVPIDNYTLRVSYVGYADRRFPGTRPAGGDGANLGTIRLASETTRAGAVEVMAERPAARMETDRNVYDTGEDAPNTGGTACSWS